MLRRVARWNRFLPRFLQPKFFVTQYYTLPPDIWAMCIYDGITERNDHVLVKDVTYWEAEALIKMLPNEGRLKLNE